MSESFDFPSYISSGGVLTYNKATKVFTLSVNYGCISCDQSKGTAPNLYLKVYTSYFSREPHFVVIPLIVEPLQREGFTRLGLTHSIQLGTIRLADYADQWNRKAAGIKVHQDGTVESYPIGQFPFPIMERMTTISCTEVTPKAQE